MRCSAYTPGGGALAAWYRRAADRRPYGHAFGFVVGAGFIPARAAQAAWCPRPASPWCPRGGGIKIPEGIRACGDRQLTTPQSAFGCQLPFTGEPKPRRLSPMVSLFPRKIGDAALPGAIFRRTQGKFQPHMEVQKSGFQMLNPGKSHFYRFFIRIIQFFRKIIGRLPMEFPARFATI